MDKIQTLVSRRAFLYTLLTMPPALFLAACSTQAPPLATIPAAPATVSPTLVAPTVSESTDVPPTDAPTQVSATTVAQLEPTPACGDDDDEPTPAQTEGPYYTPNTPERASLLETGMAGTKLALTGLVVNLRCEPVARALVDFWQCDDAGVYDNVGYTLRGHQFTDAQGIYRLETIVPGLYPGRTRHIHVKVQAPNQPVLTTQLYFPNEPRNLTDGIYRAECEMAIQENGDGSRNGAFNFVLNI